MSDIYQLYLQNSGVYAAAIWALIISCLLTIPVVWGLYIRLGNHAPDGLPNSRLTITGAIAAASLTVVAIITIVANLTSAVLVIASPELWAMQMALRSCN
jgi:hypothetical protein